MTYDILCISGAGIKIINILGLLHFYNEKIKFLHKIKIFSGTSAGSIICCLLILGYSPIDILIYFCKNEVNDLFHNISTDNKNFGLFNIEPIKLYFENMIINKIGFVPTMEQFYTLNNKHFICCSYNLSKDEKIYFDYLKTPEIKVSDAVIASCLIPLVFTKFEINQEMFIDGAFFDVFPLEYTINQTNIFDKVLGILVINKSEIENTTDYILKIVSTISNTNINKDFINKLENDDKLDLIRIQSEMNQLYFYQTKKNRIDEFCKSYEILNEFLKNKKKKIKQD